MKLISVLSPFPGISKTTSVPFPLSLILSEVEIVVENKPDNFLIWRHFCHFHRAAVRVFVTIRPLIAKVVVLPSMFSDHQPQGLLIAAKASSGDWSTEKVVV